MNDASTASTAADPTHHGPWKAALLLTGGLFVGALLARLGAFDPEPALAEMALKEGPYSAMTTRSGSQEHLFVIDERNEALLVYSPRQARSIELVARESLPEMFAAARERAGLPPRGRTP